MIRLSDIPADLATRAGVAVTSVATGGGWLADVMAWNWGVISFITATACAIFTVIWNIYAGWRRLRLQEEAVRKGLSYYELKK
jgi:hypothetical protein